MKTKAQLQRERDKIQRQLDEIENRRRVKVNGKLVGRCFKYNNTYNGKERWWIYMKIISGGERMTGLKFQETVTNHYEVDIDPYVISLDGWLEIDSDTFDGEWQLFVMKLSDLHN